MKFGVWLKGSLIYFGQFHEAIYSSDKGCYLDKNFCFVMKIIMGNCTDYVKLPIIIFILNTNW